MNGGTITGNTANGDVGGPGIGGGVYVIGEYDETAVGGGLTPGGKFTMNGGTISSNTAENNGGGVYVGRHANYIKNGGSITGNIPDNVYREP
jgi:hypothetical protein